MRHLLTNATYCGKVHYRGVTYQGEHPAIIEPALWEDINREFSKREKVQPEPDRTPQKALLAGLLTCNQSQQPMVATYTDKNARRYHYYVCHTAREKGWKACSTKSVSASLLERSVVTELQTHLDRAETHKTFHVPVSDRQALLNLDPGIIPKLIERVCYDASGAVLVTLRTDHDSRSNDEAVTFEYRLPARRGRALPAFRRQSANEMLTRPPRLARWLRSPTSLRR